jgi:glycosyltransferase involved in cell wall biosynthesis
VVVSLNPGDKLLLTLDSIFSQTYENYEVIWKDGGSTDGSARQAQNKYGEDSRLRQMFQKDNGIYDAMNQAIELVKGRYVLFLNCGDTFYRKDVLEKITHYAEKIPRETVAILYGDTYKEGAKVIQYAAPVINGFACYRNMPCHQSCFTDKRLFEKRKFLTEYHIRGDYEFFLWCYFEQKVYMGYLGLTVSSYEGGGYSENKENVSRDKIEHQQITGKYMSLRQRIQYRSILWLTAAPLRKKLAESPRFSNIYENAKKYVVYGKSTKDKQKKKV